MRQALQVKTDWQARLVPSRNLGVEFSDPAYGLAKQLALMPALPDKTSAELLKHLFVLAVVNLSDATLNL